MRPFIQLIFTLSLIAFNLPAMANQHASSPSFHSSWPYVNQLVSDQNHHWEAYDINEVSANHEYVANNSDLQAKNKLLQLMARSKNSNNSIKLDSQRPIFIPVAPGEIIKMERQSVVKNERLKRLAENATKYVTIDIHVAQGRGVFREQADKVWRSERVFYQNKLSRSVWLMLRANGVTEDIIFYKSHQDSLITNDEWVDLGNTLENFVDVINYSQNQTKPLLFLEHGDSYRYTASFDQRIKVDYYADFSLMADATNVATELTWTINKNTQQSKKFYVNPNFRVRYSRQCSVLLGFKQSAIIKLKKGQTLTLNASHNAYLGLSSNRNQDYLFTNNRPDLKFSTNLSPGAENEEQKWYTVLRALGMPVQLNLSDHNNKFLRRRHLYPQANSVPMKLLYSARGSPLSKYTNELYFTDANSHSNYQKLVLGQYYSLENKSQSKSFSLARNRAVKEIELEVAFGDTSNELVPFEIQFDNQKPERWLAASRLINSKSELNLLHAYLETSISRDQTKQVSLSNEFGSFKQKAPMVKTGFAYIPTPSSSKSLRVMNAESSAAMWVSVRDFSYRSYLKDTELLETQESRTVEQLIHAFQTFKKQASSQAVNKRYLIKQLESLPNSEQIDLIIWARFFESTFDAWNESSVAFEKISLTGNSNKLTRFEKENPLWMNLLADMVNGPNPELAISYLSATLIYNPDDKIQKQALQILFKQVEHTIQLSRLEKIILAALYQDMTLLSDFQDELLWIWSKQGKYPLIKTLPKLSEADHEYELLTAISAKDKVYAQQLIGKSKSSLSADFSNLVDVYERISGRGFAVNSANKKIDMPDAFTQKKVLDRFGYWQKSNHAVRRFDQHFKLQHVSRHKLSIDAFLIDPNTKIILSSKQLERYRIKAAPLSVKPTNDAQNLFARIDFSRGKQLVSRHLTSKQASNWMIEQPIKLDSVLAESSPSNTAPTLVGAFNTISIDDKFHDGGQIIVTANIPVVVYLERLEDPLSLLQMQAESYDAVDHFSSAFQSNSLAKELNTTQSYFQFNQCKHSEPTFLTLDSWYYPLKLDQLAPSFDRNDVHQYYSMPDKQTIKAQDCDSRKLTCFDHLAGILDQQNIKAAAKLLNLAERQGFKLSYPGIRAEVFKKVRWRELDNVPNIAGSVRVQEKDASPFNALAVQRGQLSTAKLITPYRITGDTIQGFNVNSKRQYSEKITLLVEKLAFEPTRTIRVWIKLGDEKSKLVSLQSGIPKEHTIKIKRGKNDIKIWLALQNQKETLSIKVDPRGKLPFDRSRKYLVATKDKPITLKVLGPQRVKSISKLKEKFHVEEHYVPKGWQTLTFTSETQDETFYRFYVLQEKHPKPESNFVPDSIAEIPSYPPILNRAHWLTEDADFAISEQGFIEEPTAKQRSRFWFNVDTGPLNIVSKQSKSSATKGVELSYVDRENGEDDFESTANLGPRFVDIHGFLRQYYENRNHVLSLDARHRNYDSTSVSVDQLAIRYDWLPSGSSNGTSTAVALDLWRQGSQLNQGGIESGRLSGHLRYQAEPFYQHRLSTRFEVWQRVRSINNQANYSLIDPDVWSLYKENHKRGASFSQRWSYRSHLDSQLYGKARVLLNDDFTSIDRNSWQLGWRAYINRASFDVNVINRRFFDDLDRTRSSNRNDLRASTDWLIPVSRLSNIKLSLRAQYNTDNSQLSWRLSLGWFQHSGQQLYDFRPGEYRFRSARNWWLDRSLMQDSPERINLPKKRSALIDLR